METENSFKFAHEVDKKVRFILRSSKQSRNKWIFSSSTIAYILLLSDWLNFWAENIERQK